MASSTPKDALTANLADARTRMTGLARALRYDLQILPRMQANIARNRLAWISGAVLAGFIISRLLSPREHVTIKAHSRKSDAAGKAGAAAVGLTVLKFALDFARPALLRYIASRFRAPGNHASR